MATIFIKNPRNGGIPANDIIDVTNFILISLFILLFKKSENELILL